MKTFATNGKGSQQTLVELESEKIPVYEDLADAESDLANLAENQIIATHDTGSELSAPVDVVQSSNMHAVTSNAVAEELQDNILQSPITITDLNTQYLVTLKREIGNRPLVLVFTTDINKTGTDKRNYTSLITYDDTAKNYFTFNEERSQTLCYAFVEKVTATTFNLTVFAGTLSSADNYILSAIYRA